MSFIDKLKQCDCDLYENEPLSKHTTFRIGGPAKYFAVPRNLNAVKQLISAARDNNVNFVILGRGSNVLAADEGFDGLVIRLSQKYANITVEGSTLYADAGASLARICKIALDNHLGGLEFAWGIPGSVGGAVYMNAGAYGGELCQICVAVEVMDMDGNVRILSNAQMGFSYRHSILEEVGGIVISADFQLVPAPVEEIKGKMKELMSKRSASQPLDLPSAGSAFKRPVGGYAAALIDQAGLKGYRVGDAAVSEKHGGFAVNLGNASADDVKQLLRQVSDIVFEKSGIRLEPEVRIW